MMIKRILRLARALGLLSLAGCSMNGDRIAARFIAEMDARPPEERVPNWETTKALMLRDAPKVGDEAPDFMLRRRDGGESIRLSQFKGGKPLVLIFGSWT